MLSDTDIARLVEVAVVLLPGDESAPAAAALPDLGPLIARALKAIGREAEDVQRGLGLLPDPIGWESLERFSDQHAQEFEVISATVAGAYFMSPTALDAIGYPHGPRKAPRNDLAADQLSSGVLEPMLMRESMVREVPA